MLGLGVPKTHEKVLRTEWEGLWGIRGFGVTGFRLVVANARVGRQLDREAKVSTEMCISLVKHPFVNTPELIASRDLKHRTGDVGPLTHHSFCGHTSTWVIHTTTPQALERSSRSEHGK